MTNPIRRSVMGLSMVVGAALLATSALAQVGVAVVVPTAPPAARVEVVPAPPHAGAVWQQGYYRWNGHEHEWNAGRYADAPRPGAHWTPGTWEHRGNGYVYTDGRWG